MAVPPTELNRALDSVAAFFESRQTRAGVVARRLLGSARPDDERLISQLISERRRKTRLDGGIGGWVSATTWSAWELLQLGCPPDHMGLSRMIGYLLARQDAPGRFGEGCSERRHKLGYCHHFISGFFSPGSKDETAAPLVFPSGAVITKEWDARFAVSCFALRTVLHARQERRDAVRRHIDSLVFLAERWEQDEFPVNRDVAFTAMAAIAAAPLGQRERAVRIAERLIERQRPDGTWENASHYHAVDALLALSTPIAQEAMIRAAQKIVADQRPDGSFDEQVNEEIALIALRAIRSIGAQRAKPRPPRLSPVTLPVRGR